MDLGISTVADEYRREYMEALESFPFEGLKAWGAVALLFHRGFRGSYADICRELGWFDRHGKTMRSKVCRSIRNAKRNGVIPKDASFRRVAAQAQ